VIRYGQVQPHDPEDRREKPFGLPEWQVEEQTERQCGFDGEVGVLRLPATRANARGFPVAMPSVTTIGSRRLGGPELDHRRPGWRRRISFCKWDGFVTSSP
jgi:hypothetical protein